ncbi:ATP-binding protein [Candidatus Marinimicrobia bacterium MT.SAG.3]|nr:ATP-binding protein [Candidatus Marinimicrobia bacterium MT.SAG.3]
MKNELSVQLNNNKKEIRRLKKEFNKFGELHRLPKNVLTNMHVALDEVLTNVVNYGYTDKKEHQIDVHFRLKSNMIEVEVIDDARPFNILDVDEPVTQKPLEEKSIGGLGIHLIKNLMDEVEYHRRDGLNQLFLRAKILH